MQYDPVKRRLGVVFNSDPFLRKLFYHLLDLLLLRAWHIQRELRRWAGGQGGPCLGHLRRRCRLRAVQLLAQQPLVASGTSRPSM
jgi:hypothetical protein